MTSNKQQIICCNYCIDRKKVVALGMTIKNTKYEAHWWSHLCVKNVVMNDVNSKTDQTTVRRSSLVIVFDPNIYRGGQWEEND